MSDGAPYSPMVAARSSMNLASALDLLRSNASVDKKKNASKVTLALKTLLHYEFDESLLAPLVFYFSYEKPSSAGTVTRLVMYLLSYSRSDRIDEEHFPNAFATLDTLLGKKSSVPLRMETIKTFALLLPENFAAKAKVDEICTAALRVDSSTSKKSKGKDTGKSWLQYAALYAYRHRAVSNESTLGLILDGVKSDDPVAARHAFGTLSRYTDSPYRGYISGNSLQFLIAGQSGARANLEDELARVFMVRILASFGTAPPDDEAMNKDAFYSVLCQRVMDQSPRVSYEAIRWLVRGKWESLATASFSVYADADADVNFLLPLSEKTVLGAILERLCSTIAEGVRSVPLIHATLRTMIAVARAHILHMAEVSDMARAGQYLPAPIRDMSGVDRVPTPARSLVHNVPRRHLVPSLRGGVKSDEPPHPLVKMIVPLEEFITSHSSVPSKLRLMALRCMAWLAFGDSVVVARRVIEREIRQGALSGKQVREIFQELLERVKVTPNATPMVLELIQVWRECAPQDVCVDIVRQLWDCIGSPPSHSGMLQVLESIFKFLDVGQREEHLLEDHRLRQFANAYLGERGYYLAQTPDEEVNSAILGAILCRLESDASFGCSEMQMVAFDALAKLAILASGDVRTRVVSFADTISERANVCNRVHALRHVLDRLQSAHERWSSTYEENGGKLDDFVLELVSEEKMLRKSCGLFLTWPSDRSCIGEAFTPFVVQST